MLGCGALDAGTPAAQSNTGLVATSAVMDFGSVPLGTTQVRTNTITNNAASLDCSNDSSDCSGGGIYNNGATLSLRNTIVAGNGIQRHDDGLPW